MDNFCSPKGKLNLTVRENVTKLLQHSTDKKLRTKRFVCNLCKILSLLKYHVVSTDLTREN